jgi:hypothetical protein
MVILAETRKPVVLETRLVVPFDEEAALIGVDPQLDQYDSRQ